MRSMLSVLLLLGLAAGAYALDASKLDYTFMAGYSKPVGGDWAKNYRSSPFIGVGAEYDTGTEFRWGLEMGYDSGHEHKVISAYSPRVLFVAPYLKEYRFYDNWEYYALIGAGLYHRWSPEYTDAGVTYKGGLSGKLGASGGFGGAYYLGDDMKIGLDVRMHYIRRLLGINGGMASASNFTPSVTFSKKF